MTLAFLGTGTSQGVPVIACPCNVCHSTDSRDKRLRSSALVTDNEGNNVLIDIGPDFRAQMLAFDVRHLEAILITHAHRDHVGGIDDIRPFNWVQQRNMDIYANTPALDTLRHDYHYIFEHHQYPGLPEATLHDVSDCAPFNVGQLTITPIAGMHKDLSVLGFRFDQAKPYTLHPTPYTPASLAYITDMNHLPDAELQKLRNLDVLVINALRQNKHFSHFCLREALDIIARVAPRQAYLTHMSHEMGLHAEVDPTLPPNVHLAHDNLTLKL